MRQFESRSAELTRMFESSFGARDIAESLVSFDSGRSCGEIFEFMERHKYDTVGVRVEGSTAGYVVRDSQAEGTLQDKMKTIEEECVVDERAPLSDVLSHLEHRGWVVVLVAGHPWGIATVADIEKTPVRMYLFGLVSLIEMAMLNLIKKVYPSDEWKDSLRDSRVAKARELLGQRTQLNAELDLADCLQFCDKRDILKVHAGFLTIVGMKKREWDRTLKQVEKLRNELAHSQSLVKNMWPALAQTSKTSQTLLHSIIAATEQIL